MIKIYKAKVAARKKPNFMKQIEKHPNVTKRELVFAKRGEKGNERFMEIPSEGTERLCEFDTDDIPRSHAFFEIHTHIEREGDHTFALPGSHDLRTLSNVMMEGKGRIGVVVSVNKKGKTTGYVLFKISKMLSKRESEELIHFVQNKTSYMKRGRGGWYTLPVPNFSEKEHEATLEFLEQKGCKYSQIIRPMPGYVFDKMKCAFVRKNGRK